MIVLRKLEKSTATALWLGWDPIADVQVFLFYSAGVLRSRAAGTNKDGSPRVEVKFGVGQDPYEVVALVRDPTSGAFTVERGEYSEQPPPPPPLTLTQTITEGETLSGDVIWEAFPSGAVDYIEFWIDGALAPWQRENYAPYVYNGDGGKLDTATLGDGAHVFETRAYVGSAVAASVSATATVANAPPPPPPPPPGEGFDFPAKFHIWGGNEAVKAKECDFVAASYVSSLDPRVIRQTNPGVVLVSHPNLAPYDPRGYCWERGFAWTYGAGIRGGASGRACADQGVSLPPWPGVNDTLLPNPQGEIRGYEIPGDDGCKQTDGNQGFALHKPETADLFARALFYAWKAMKMDERGWDGLWSDNLFPGNLLHAGWAWGTCASDPAMRAAWDEGLLTILRHLRAKIGHPIHLGGNVIYDTTNAYLRAETSVALVELLYDEGADHSPIFRGPDPTWEEIQAAHAWASAPSIDGKPKLLNVNFHVSRADVRMQRFCAAIACIMGAAFNCYENGHGDTFWPDVTYRNGERGYLGKPIGPPERSGGVFSRRYPAGVVSANFSDHSVVFP